MMNQTRPICRRPQVWSLCFARLNAQPDWLERWLIGWGLLITWGAFAFLIAPGSVAFAAQATFFVGLFPWILLPLAGAIRLRRCQAAPAAVNSR